MTRTVLSRWLPCGDWSGVVAERRIEPEEPPEWPDSEDWERRDGREVALTVGGQDWLAAIQDRLDGARGAVTLRWDLIVTDPSGGYRAGEPMRGVTSSEAIPVPRRLLVGRYGAMNGPGGLTWTLAGLVGSVVALSVAGRVAVAVEDQVLVTLAHPWRGYGPGATVTVPPGMRQRLDAAGYALRP